MTDHAHTPGKGPFIDDLRILHRYARSRLPDQKLSQQAFSAELAKLGIKTSVDVISAAFHRLEREYDVILMQRRPTHGPRGEEVAPKPRIAEHLDHPEDWEAYPSPDFSSRNKSRLTLDGEIFAEVASLLAGYEAIARAATGRTGTRADGKKARPDPADRRAVLGWLRMQRRRLQKIVETTRADTGSVFGLQHFEDPEYGLVPESADTIIMELAPRMSTREPDEE